MNLMNEPHYKCERMDHPRITQSLQLSLDIAFFSLANPRGQPMIVQDGLLAEREYQLKEEGRERKMPAMFMGCLFPMPVREIHVCCTVQPRC